MFSRHGNKTVVVVVFGILLCCLLITIIQYNIQNLPPGLDLCQKLNKDFNEKTLGNSSWWQYVCLFEREVDKPLSYDCKDSRWMGNWRVCFDKKYRPRKPCLVYSVGIANDFSFDDAMAAVGCEVFSFDPSMGEKDHQRSERVYFKNLALGNQDTDNFSPRFDEYVTSPQKWKMRTLKSIREMLNHEKRFIDVLKFDVEGGEWETMKNIIQDGLLPQIGQILTEWHIFPDEPPRQSLKSNFHLVSDLKRLGLQQFYKHSFYRVHRNMFFNSQCDVCYVNTKANRH